MKRKIALIALALVALTTVIGLAATPTEAPKAKEKPAVEAPRTLDGVLTKTDKGFVLQQKDAFFLIESNLPLNGLENCLVSLTGTIKKSPQGPILVVNKIVTKK